MKSILASAALFGFWVLAGVSTAWAASPSVVARFAGSASVVRVTPYSHWAASWSAVGDGSFTLTVVNTENGERQDVTNVDNPGGICWIPKADRLLYCKGIYNDKIEATRVIYYVYDVATKETSKVVELTDILETYQLDPVAAEDGSKLFHMIVDSRQVPSFNLYLPDAGLLTPRQALTPQGSAANIGSDYDLSSDGKVVYWYAHEPETDSFFIVGWDLELNTYTELYEYGASADPADDHALFKIDSPHLRGAAITASDSDPTLKLCVYDFLDLDNLYIVPVHLDQAEDIMYFDWKGRGGWVYALVLDSTAGEYSIQEINPFSGERRVLLRTTDEISFLDYASADRTYYYTVVDDRDTQNPQTLLMRLPLD